MASHRARATRIATVAAPARAMATRRLATAAAPPAAAKPPDNRPWFIRNWGTSLFLSFGGTWAYTMWVSNKARKASDAAEEAVKARLPANNDELLELRALNDASNSAIVSLRSRVSGAGSPTRVSGPAMISALRSAVAPPGTSPQPLKEEYVLERMMMALPERDAAGTADVRLAASALAFLSAGTVGERIETMYAALVQPEPPAARQGKAGAASSGDSGGGVPVALLAPLLRMLVATGQVPPEKVVCVEDEGRDAVGVQRSWYRVPPVREFTAEEWAAALLEEHCGVAAAASDGAADGARGAQAVAAPPEHIELEQFAAMLQSQRVCLWGECYQISERRRLSKLKEEAEEYARNPPWYRRAWNAVSAPFGGGKAAAQS
jgi:hypothetical protein